jgi:hypothetical protein
LLLKPAKKLPQQWSPLLSDIPFTKLTEHPQQKLSKYNVTYSQLKTAMNDYLARLTENPDIVFTIFHANQTIQLSERLWLDSNVYSCEAYKNTKKSTRNDSHCQFTATHKLT